MGQVLVVHSNSILIFLCFALLLFRFFFFFSSHFTWRCEVATTSGGRLRNRTVRPIIHRTNHFSYRTALFTALIYNLINYFHYVYSQFSHTQYTNIRIEHKSEFFRCKFRRVYFLSLLHIEKSQMLTVLPLISAHLCV